MSRTLRTIIFVFIAGSLMLAACGQAAPAVEPTTAPEPTKIIDIPTTAPEPTKASETTPTEAMPAGSVLPEVNPADLSGSVNAAGSSTVYPLAEAIAENFRADGYPLAPAVVSNASARPVKPISPMPAAPSKPLNWITVPPSDAPRLNSV
jgi:ABC-type phosphate transport system substrate-binding protein